MFKNFVKNIIANIMRLGASGAEVYLSETSGLNLTVRLGEVETVEHSHDKGVDIIAYFGQRTGTANSTDLSDSALQLTVDKACYLAKYAQEDPFAGLADRELLAFDYQDLDLYYPWNLEVSHAVELAKQAEAAGIGVDKRITNSDGATISSQSSNYCYGNSNNFVGQYSCTRHRFGCSLIAENAGEKQRDYDYAVAIDAAKFESFENVARRAAEKSVARLGAKKINTIACPVIFTASVAKTIWGSLLAAISGSNIYRQSSFLLDQLEQQILPEFITIDERPQLLKTLGSAPYDNDGVRTTDKDIVRDGILCNYLLSSYTARKLNMKTTGNAGGVHNLFVSHSNDDLAAMLKTMQRGLLVTELIGQGVNIITGDYSRGAFGYWVEHGEVQYPVHEITIAGNLKEMLRSIVIVGNDLDRRGSVITGSILIDNMTVAGG